MWQRRVAFLHRIRPIDPFSCVLGFGSRPLSSPKEGGVPCERTTGIRNPPVCGVNECTARSRSALLNNRGVFHLVAGKCVVFGVIAVVAFQGRGPNE
jgi:hypothetical protein